MDEPVEMKLEGQQVLFTNPVYDDNGKVKGSPPPSEPTDVPRDKLPKT